MKARIKKTGEIVDVYHEPQHGTQTIIYKESVFVNSRMWTEDELELLTNDDEHQQEKGTIMKKYIEAILAPLSIFLIAIGVHDTNAIYCLIGGICTGVYVSMQNATRAY